MKRLSTSSWHVKLYSLLAACVVTIAALSSLAIYAMQRIGDQAKVVEESARVKISAALSARLAVLNMDNAQISLIAADSASEIRKSAIASIKAASELDDALAALKVGLPQSQTVDTLIRKAEEIKGPRIEVIQFAKKNDDESALDKVKALDADFKLIDTLSNEVLTAEQNHLTDALTQNAEFSHQVTQWMYGIIAPAIALILFLGVFIKRAIQKPLETAVGDAQRLAQGNLSKQAGISDASASRDEIGAVRTSISEIASGLSLIVTDLRGEALTLSQQAQQMNMMSEHVSDSHDTVNAITDRVASTSENVSALAASTGRELETLVKTCESTQNAASMNSEAALQVSQHTTAALGTLEEALAKIVRLEASSKVIGAISSRVGEISSQTNLLALNAAIEAARAGDAGRGFSVVADEVRKLSEQTTQATQEINQTLHQIRQDVEESSRTVHAVQSAMQTASSYATKMTGLAELTTSTANDTRSYLTGLNNRLKEMISSLTSIQSESAELQKSVTLNSGIITSLSGSASAVNESAKNLSQSFGKFITQ